MRFIEVCGIMLAALFILPATIGVANELTGIISENVELTAEMELALDAYPLGFLALPIVMVIMLFRRRKGADEEEQDKHNAQRVQN